MGRLYLGYIVPQRFLLLKSHILNSSWVWYSLVRFPNSLDSQEGRGTWPCIAHFGQRLLKTRSAPGGSLLQHTPRPSHCGYVQGKIGATDHAEAKILSQKVRLTEDAKAFDHLYLKTLFHQVSGIFLFFFQLCLAIKQWHWIDDDTDVCRWEKRMWRQGATR